MYVGAFLELEYENQDPVEYEHLIRCYVARTEIKRQQSLTSLPLSIFFILLMNRWRSHIQQRSKCRVQKSKSQILMSQNSLA